jgi:subtilisin family serine protease
LLQRIQKQKNKLENAIKKATENGIIVVAAAGNRYGDPTDFPASYEKVISVTAIDRNNSIAKFASQGKIDFSAPGVDIPIILPNNEFDVSSGTSLSAAYITGVISLFLQDRDTYKIDTTKNLYEQVYTLLESRTIDKGIPGKDSFFGEGTIHFIKNRGVQ